MKVVLDHVTVEAPHISTFFFRPEKPVQYVAGQYVELTLKHDEADNRGEKRRFTLSSSPSEELLSITNKFSPKDGSTFKDALGLLKSGDTLLMSEPKGDFVLRDRARRARTSLIFVAGGIGITPFRSMVTWLQAKGERPSIRLLYTVAREEDIVFRSTFEGFVEELRVTVSNPSPSWKGERGYLTAARILGTEEISPDTLIYLSGPEAMVIALRKDLLAAGIAERQLVLDRFKGYSAA